MERRQNSVIISRRTMLAGIGSSALLPHLRLSPAHAAGEPMVLEAVAAKARLMDEGARETAVWAYGGTVPGPAIRTKAGSEMFVRFVNKLDQPTSVHWHGIRIDNRMDGVSGLTQEPVEPGESFDYRFIAPDPGTFWYHPHNRSWEQLARGLYGPLILDEVSDPGFDGEITLVLDDWRLTESGHVHEESFGGFHDWSHEGRLGNWMTVNGQSNPELTLEAGKRYRLRLINTANARVFRLKLDALGKGRHGTGAAKLIALDGMALTERLTIGDETLLLAPAQRADIAFSPAPGTGLLDLAEATGEPFAFARLRVEGDAAAAAKLPELPAPDLPQPDLSNATRLPFVMEGGAMGWLIEARHKGEVLDGRTLAREHGQMWAFNGVAGMEEMPMFTARRGETLHMEIDNRSRWPHAIHIHGHHFKVLERNGVPEAQPMWRDTILLDADETAGIAFVADNPGKWMIHCHMLEHQAAGMGTWFHVL